MNKELEDNIITLVLETKAIRVQRKTIEEMLFTKTKDMHAWVDHLFALERRNLMTIYRINTIFSKLSWPDVSTVPEETLDIVSRAANIVTSFHKPDPILRPLSPLESVGSLISAIAKTAYKAGNSSTYEEKQVHVNYLNELYIALDNTVFITVTDKIKSPRLELFMEI